MSEHAESFLTDIREAVKAAMEADPYYLDIPIITERLRNIEGRIAETVGRAGGLAIVLVTPSVGGAIQNVRGANFSAIRLVARIYESPTRNRTGLEALDIAVHTAALWSGMGTAELAGNLRLDDSPINLGNDPQYLTYDVTATTEGGIALSIPRLESIAADGASTVTLTHGTPGAAIFFTADRSRPIPRNPAASLYAAPVALAPGQQLRAAAFLAGYLPSPELVHQN